METLRWGILGAANFALGHMAPAIHAVKGNQLYALATSSAEKALPFKAFCTDLEIHSRNNALLSDPRVE